MSVTEMDLIENLFYINGVPMKIDSKDRIHLHDIYNSQADSQLLRFARQTEKSTTVAAKMVTRCVRYSNYKETYIAPTLNQVSDFSNDKLDAIIDNSPIIQKNLRKRKRKRINKNQVHFKEFPNGSKMWLRSAYHSADSTRGLSNDALFFDEVQDICSEHLPVIEQSASSSMKHYTYLKQVDEYIPFHLFGYKSYSGTPKTVDNTMEKLWSNSSQKEWIIQCHHTGCKKHNFIDEKNIGDTCLICKNCGKPIYYENGQWIIMNSKGFIDGYRMPQISLNWINDRNNPLAWLRNVTNLMKTYTTERVYNEILALPYANAKHPLSRGEMLSCCEDYGMASEEAVIDKFKVVYTDLTAGIDWGKGDTASGTSYSVLTIGGYLKGKYRVVFIKKYVGRLSDPLVQIKDMLRIIKRFDVKLVLADTGDGRVANALMVDELGALRFAEILEHGTIKEKIKWDGDLGHYIMNRTRLMTDIMMRIKRKEVSFFRANEFEPYMQDFTGIYQEYSEQTRMMRYDHVVPDDCFHSFMFWFIANMIVRGELDKYLIGG